MTLAAFHQITVVLNKCQNAESIAVAKETLASTLKDLIPLLTNNANKESSINDVR
jgi:hypothetical protein